MRFFPEALGVRKRLHIRTLLENRGDWSLQMSEQLLLLLADQQDDLSPDEWRYMRASKFLFAEWSATTTDRSDVVAHYRRTLAAVAGLESCCNEGAHLHVHRRRTEVPPLLQVVLAQRRSVTGGDDASVVHLSRVCPTAHP